VSGDAAAGSDFLATRDGALRGATCVIKIGGSLLSLPDLRSRIEQMIRECAPCRPLLVIGGGAMVDVVREWDHLHALGDEASHQLALSAMSVTAHFIHRLLDGSVVVEDQSSVAAAWEDGRIAIVNAETWLAGVEGQGAWRLPRSWSVTSDSIAACIAGEIGAERLVLAKSTAKPSDVADAVRAGHVDAAFADFASRLPRVDWVNLRDPTPVVERWIDRDERHCDAKSKEHC
jgi:dihydroneopterin aldolase